MERKEIVLDRIKGCLAAVALSDALQNLKLSRGIKFNEAFKDNPYYKPNPIPEKYKRFYEGKNTTDRKVFVGFNGSPTMPPSDGFKDLIACMYSLMKWREDLQKTGIYTDPVEYINSVVDKSAWTKKYSGEYFLAPEWITSISVGLLGNFIFDFSEDVNRDIRAVSASLFNNIRESDDEEFNAECISNHKTQYGLFAVMLRNLIIHEGYVDAPLFYTMYMNCAMMDQYGDEEYRAFIVSEANEKLKYLQKSDSVSDNAARNDFEWSSWEELEEGSSFNTFFYTGIRCSANMGCLNGYDSISFKDMFKYVGVMSEVEKLVDDISLLIH